MLARARLNAAVELLTLIRRTADQMRSMKSLNEDNLIACCDHLEDLVEQTRRQVTEARVELTWYGTTDRMAE